MMRDQKLWTWHIIAGGVILVFLGLHMLTMHMEGVIEIRGLNPASVEQPGKAEVHPIDWANVQARGVRALYMASYIVLLGAALFHGLYGLNNIIREANPAKWVQKAVTAVLLLVGVGLFVYGTWAAIVARAVARAAVPGM